MKNFIKLIIPPVAAFLVAGIATAGSYVEMAGSLAGVTFMVPLFVEFFKVTFKLKDKIFWGIKSARALSWGLSILLVYISSVAGWGVFSELQGWIQIIITGLGVGLASNGYFTIATVKLILEELFKYFKND